MRTRRRSRRLWLVLVGTITVAMLMIATPGAAHDAGPGPLVNVNFVGASTNDDGSGGDGDDGGPPVMYDGWGPLSSADPSAPGPGAARYDKDVARCTATVRAADPQYVDVLIENGYPAYVCTFTVTVLNASGLPVSVFPAVLAADPQLVLAAAAPQLPATLLPGGSGSAAFSLTVLQVAAQNSTYHATVTIELLTDAGNIIVDKVTDPAGDPQSFTFHPSWGADFTLTDAAAPHDSGLLPPGVYSVAEIVPDGWSLAAATCDDESAVGSIGLSGGETVTCTFYDSRVGQPGSIQVRKRVDPNNPETRTQLFEFDTTWGPNLLISAADNWVDSGPLGPGSYAVAEVNLPAEWTLLSGACVGRSGVTMDPSAITLHWNEKVRCTFRDLYTQVLPPAPTLTIVKEAFPADDTVFSFDGGRLPDFTLQDPSDSFRTFIDLEVGEYTITELGAEGFDLIEVECIAEDYNVAGTSVTLNLQEGEAAVCTFRNGQLPYTGAPGWVTPVAAGGVATMLMGLLILAWAEKRRRQEG